MLVRCKGTLLVAVLLLQWQSIIGHAADFEVGLEKAIATLRNVEPAKMSSEEKDRKSAELDRAWSTIQAAGASGADRIKRELATLEANQEKDYFFRLSVAALLFRVGQFDEADTVLRIWRTTPVTYHYEYVFRTAARAAATRDPRAIPLMREILRDADGVLETAHGRIMAPHTHMLVWGVFGPTGLLPLLEILNQSGHPVELWAAAHLLGDAQYMEALPRIRALTQHRDLEVRLWAIQAIGGFGHPEDFAALINGLRSQDLATQEAWAEAAGDFGDLRVVPDLLPLLNSSKATTRQTTVNSLSRLLTSKAVEALFSCARSDTYRNIAQRCAELHRAVLERVSLSWEDFRQLALEEQERLLAKVRYSAYEEGYRLHEGP